MSYAYLMWSLWRIRPGAVIEGDFDPRRFARRVMALLVVDAAIILAVVLLRGGGVAADKPLVKSQSIEVIVEPKVKLSRLVGEYGDLRYREGSADGLGDRETSRLRRSAAEKTLAKITELIK